MENGKKDHPKTTFNPLYVLSQAVDLVTGNKAAEEASSQQGSGPQDNSGENDKDAEGSGDAAEVGEEVHLCQVCQKKQPNGHHYGVLSCEACKSFFKRTTRQQRSNKLPQHWKCSKSAEGAQPSHQKCRLCMWERCLQAGMDDSRVMDDEERVAFMKKRQVNGEKRKQAKKQRLETGSPDNAAVLRKAHQIAVMEDLLSKDVLPWIHSAADKVDFADCESHGGYLQPLRDAEKIVIQLCIRFYDRIYCKENKWNESELAEQISYRLLPMATQLMSNYDDVSKALLFGKWRLQFDTVESAEEQWRTIYSPLFQICRNKEQQFSEAVGSRGLMACSLLHSFLEPKEDYVEICRFRECTDPLLFVASLPEKLETNPVLLSVSTLIANSMDRQDIAKEIEQTSR